MLVLSRKKQQSIVINNNVRVVVLGIHGNQVRLGFEAPKDVPIHRREISTKLNPNDRLRSDRLVPAG